MKSFNCLLLSLLISGSSAFVAPTVKGTGSSTTTQVYGSKNIDDENKSIMERRTAIMNVISGATATAAFAAGLGVTNPSMASAAKPDCMADCVKNCKKIAPKDSEYCLGNCKEYCAQEDRTDGLSGSVSSEGGEVGLLGQGTVVKGEDKPPVFSIPGLDFSSEKGKKLIGY
mmetsp:Transcript_26379/g.40328  ORF Transcript_26379/g.40328 Transcript_26379/m.40328 type:complete len:171 (-) Transcript_26379:196-708(-)|eukprot:CAMPEP_0194083872 /NCGR_PEP_ID=MMETSP0149-20130528/10118_1 /TAXON_ID=122233 /ORGANISM="Chaetoceros debilis, Strain MM31A-1" /LENGTH=170 /DNA_ID=CAMNT_0038766351 /DNA_START=136 /DNA_END=648 /DNA_ORIENTATION=+